MKRKIQWIVSTIAAVLLFVSAGVLAARAEVGHRAPGFIAVTTQGKKINLRQYRGRVVVMEWTNNDCPFVKKHYLSGNMQAMQKKFMGKGVIWLRVNSSARGKQGHITPYQSRMYVRKRQVYATATILDEMGRLGRLYRIRTTPEVVVINQRGTLVYRGAVDNKPSTKLSDVKTAKNYLAAAIKSALAKKSVRVSQTKPYGCGVKY